MIQIGCNPRKKIRISEFAHDDGGIPNQTDALFWLDGTISGDEFVDKSGNGRNFTITSKDFPDNWSKGFPYKSAATISAPVGDATLIAADVNNFLYDSAGDPNAIPVVSFFQDIEYANKLFCRHKAQVLNVVGVETYEPRVLDIVLYDTVKAGDDLTTCQTYYGVPTEQTSTVKWISKGGNDTTGNGTKALPWLTLTKAEASATAGDTVYVKSGTYDEVDFWQPRADRTWIATGGVTVTSSGASYVLINSLTNDVHINGFILDGESATAYSAFISGDTTLDKCLFKNATTDTVYTTGNVVAINNSIIMGGGGDLRKTTNFNTCLLNIDKTIDIKTNSENYTLTNCNTNINGTTSIVGIKYNNNNQLTILGGNLNFISCQRGIYNTTARTGSKLSIKYCNIVNTLSSVHGISLLGDVNDVEILYNTVTNNYTKTILSGTDQTLIDVSNNFILSDFSSSITIKTSTVATDLTISNNYIKANYATGYAMSIGSETTGAGDDAMGSITIEKNTILGQRYYTSAATPSTHGIFIGFQGVTASIKYNYVNGVGLGIVLKGSNTDMADSIIQSNVITNSTSYGVYPKGIDNAKFIGNTLIENNREFHITENVGSDPCNGLLIKNNILENSSGYLYSFDVASYAETNTIDYNVIHETDKLAYDGSADVLLAAWNTKGYDANSLNADPELTNLIPDAGSPAIGAGETLDAAYDDGLDSSTDWGDENTVPSIVTKQQTGDWDIGAYVY